MLNRSSESRHPCLVFDLRVKVFSLNNDIVYDASCSFVCVCLNAVYQNEEFPSISSFSKVSKSGIDNGVCQKLFLDLLR